MKKVANLLNLNEDANEASIENAVNKLIEANNKVVSEKQALEASLLEAQNNVAAIQAQLDQANATASEAVEMIAENNAVALVEQFKPRIGTDAKIVESWVNHAKKDMAGTKAMLEALPVNAVSKKSRQA